MRRCSRRILAPALDFMAWGHYFPERGSPPQRGCGTEKPEIDSRKLSSAHALRRLAQVAPTPQSRWFRAPDRAFHERIAGRAIRPIPGRSLDCWAVSRAPPVTPATPLDRALPP